MTHALTRTSPKGQKFVGRCVKCGRYGLPMSEALSPCPDDDRMSDKDALLYMIDDQMALKEKP